jgi:hypothetical protein
MRVKLLYCVQDFFYDESEEKWGVYEGEIDRDDASLLKLLEKSPLMEFGNGTTTECVLMNHFKSEYPPLKWTEGDPLDYHKIHAAVAFPEIRMAIQKIVDEHVLSFTYVFGPEPDLEGEYVYEYLGQFVEANAGKKTRLYRKWVLKDESRDSSPERPVK